MFEGSLKNKITDREDLDLAKMDLSVKLAVAMTEATFGHEYALLSLEEKNASYTEQQMILGQLEGHKRRYFGARKLLKQLDPQRLSALEEELRLQKETIFREKKTLH
jgi:hypothetical protein